MSDTTHTPGPWSARLPVGHSIGVPGVAWTICGPGDHDGGWLAVAEVLGTGPACQATPETNANARLIAAAPDLLAEVRETADWLEQRAGVLREIAGGMDGAPRSQSGQRRQRLLDEAARFEGRAAVIRQTILKAKGA